MYKGDLCRVAMLHELGGIYFDVDMETINPIYSAIQSADTKFCTSTMANNATVPLFQSTPRRIEEFTKWRNESGKHSKYESSNML